MVWGDQVYAFEKSVITASITPGTDADADAGVTGVAALVTAATAGGDNGGDALPPLKGE